MALGRAAVASLVLIVLILIGGIVVVVPVSNGQTIAQIIQQTVTGSAVANGITPKLSITYSDGSTSSVVGKPVAFTLVCSGFSVSGVSCDSTKDISTGHVDLSATAGFSYNGSNPTGYTLTGTVTAKQGSTTLSSATISNSGSLSAVNSATLQQVTFPVSFSSGSTISVTGAEILSTITTAGSYNVVYSLSNLALTVSFSSGAPITESLSSATLVTMTVAYSISSSGGGSSPSVTTPQVAISGASTSGSGGSGGGSYTLNIGIASGNGALSPSVAGSPYTEAAGTIVTISVTGGITNFQEFFVDGANQGYGVSTIQVTMNQNHAVLAYFAGATSNSIVKF